MKISKLLTIFGTGKTVSRAHIRNLLEMAKVDGKVDDTENELLLTIAERYQISPAVIHRLSEDDYQVTLDIPADEKEKFRQFFELVQMMMADNFMHNDELNLCYFFAQRYGYRKDKIESLVRESVYTIGEGGSFDTAWMRIKDLF